MKSYSKWKTRKFAEKQREKKKTSYIWGGVNEGTGKQDLVEVEECRSGTNSTRGAFPMIT